MTTLTRPEALERGDKRYFTGKPCPRGHVVERLVSTRACTECAHAASKAWNARNPGLAAARTRAWAKAHPEQMSACSRAWEAAHPEMVAARVQARLKRKRAKLEEIAGRPRPDRCDVCRESGRRIAFDHCHQSGKFRGWLCQRCNLLLGHAEDSAELLFKLGRYVKAHNKGFALELPPAPTMVLR